MMLTLFNYIMLSTTFTGAFVWYCGNFDFYLSYILMAFFFIYCIAVYKKIFINRTFMFLFTIMLVFATWNVYMENNTPFGVLKVFFGFIINGVVYYSLIRINSNNVEKLFKIYMKLALVVALIGMFQEISYLVGFKAGYDFRAFIPRTVRPGWQLGVLRVQSIMQEYAHLGAAMAPAVFISILNITQGTKYFINRIASWIIILCVLLSFSLLSYLSIILAFVLIMLNYRRAKMILVCIAILAVMGFTAYKTLPDIKLRINDTIAVISGKKPLDYHVTLSVFVAVRNGFVAYKSFLNNPLFGSGLGSHSLSYRRYVSVETDPDKFNYTLNNEDASGLFFRLLSETGLLGIFLFIYFMVKFYVPRTSESNLWAISNAILCLVILNLIRQGNYFYNGFIFFVWLYYFTQKNQQVNTGHN